MHHQRLHIDLWHKNQRIHVGASSNKLYTQTKQVNAWFERNDYYKLSCKYIWFDFKRLEGSSKAQIITPRSITPTNENSAKKKKQEASTESRKSMTNNKNQAPKVEVKANIPVASKIVREVTPPPKPITKTGLIRFDYLKLFFFFFYWKIFIFEEAIFGDDLNLSDGTDSESEFWEAHNITFKKRLNLFCISKIKKNV